jgi:hypothetical protein
MKQKQEMVLLLFVSVTDPDWIRIQTGQWIGSGFGIRIRIQEGKKEPNKKKKVQKFHVMMDVIF